MSETTSNRETLASRLGFIMLSAGCAIGLGNVWRFPFIVGQYGGGIFVLFYLFFLAILGYPVLMIEMAIGHGGRSNLAGAFRNLASTGKGVWGTVGRIIISGCLLLMIYYTCVSGWLFSYTGYYARGIFSGVNGENTGEFFGSLISSPTRSTGYMLLATALGTIVCWFGLRKGVECCVKYMMGALLLLMFVLAVCALTTPGAKEGVIFYLKPDWSHFTKSPLETIFAAMGQAFFTLSLGIGAMTIFGSYLPGKKSLAKECAWIVLLDTLVALCAGFIVFPICKSFGIDPAQGPGLIFVSLPKAFHSMAGERFWGTLFFFFLSLAALTTIVGVFENLIAYLQDEHKFGRKGATLAIGIAVSLLSLPCVFGYNLLSGVHPLGGQSTILDFEDFIVSQNLLPIGALVQIVFCFASFGWGRKGVVEELESGQDWKIPRWILFYAEYLLPLVILFIFILGYYQFFSK